jgi:hypothetical protein
MVVLLWAPIGLELAKRQTDTPILDIPSDVFPRYLRRQFVIHNAT